MTDQWLQQYGKYVEEAPTIDFNGTLLCSRGFWIPQKIIR